MQQEHHHTIVRTLLDKGFLASPDLLAFSSLDKEKLFTTLSANNSDTLTVITKDVYTALTSSNHTTINWTELDNTRVLYEKNNTKPYTALLTTLQPTATIIQPLPPPLLTPPTETLTP